MLAEKNSKAAIVIYIQILKGNMSSMSIQMTTVSEGCDDRGVILGFRKE